MLSNQDRIVAHYGEREHENSLFAAQHLQIKQILIDRMGPNIFEMWFGEATTISVDQEAVHVISENEFAQNRLQTKFLQAIREAVASTCGPTFSVNFTLKEDHGQEAVEESAKSASPVPSTDPVPLSVAQVPNQVMGDVAPPPERNPNRKRGIDSFWFGHNNRLAEAGVGQMFEQLGQMSPLVFYGPAGSGKSHLLESVVVEARRKHKLNRCVFLSAEQFTTNFVQALRGTGLPLFRRKYRDLDLLAIDDVHFFAGKKATLAEFQHTIDNLTRHGKQVVLSSNRPPIDLGGLGSDITTRMMSGLVCPLNYPDEKGRRKILRELCRQREFAIPGDVLDLIGQNLARDVRRLSGAVNRVHALSVAIGEPVTMEMAQQALTDLFSVHGTTTSISSIEKVVCEFCGVKPADLKSNSRQKRISAARMLAMYLSRQYTPNAFSEIGDYFGGRSHSTVIAAGKKVKSWLDSNQSIDLPHATYSAKDAVVQIESNLRIG